MRISMFSVIVALMLSTFSLASENDKKGHQITAEQIGQQADSINEVQVLSEQAKALSTLKQNNIIKGSTLWTKFPKNDLPGLAKITISDISLIRYDVLGYSNVIIEFDSISKRTTRLGYAVNFGDSYEVVVKAIADDFYTSDMGAKWGKKIVDTIEKRSVILGMTRQQVIASYGKPNDINKSVGSWGVHAQWVYDDGIYLYFENDVLKSWQN